MSNWDKGSYEITAAELAPVAPLVADAVEPVAGQPALDLACGTGNETLELARRGGEVTGLDSAPRLLEVAGERADAEGLSVDWVQSDLTELPFGEDSFEVVTSVFGLIFTSSPQTAAAEIDRVLRPQGRIAFTSWVDEGLFYDMRELAKVAVASRLGQAPADGEDAPFAWGDEGAVRELFSESGLMLQAATRELAVEHESAASLNKRWFDHHPMWLTMKDVIGDEAYDELRRETLPLIEAANEADDGGFRFTTRYLLFEGSPV